MRLAWGITNCRRDGAAAKKETRRERDAAQWLHTSVALLQSNNAAHAHHTISLTLGVRSSRSTWRDGRQYIASLSQSLLMVFIRGRSNTILALISTKARWNKGDWLLLFDYRDQCLSFSGSDLLIDWLEHALGCTAWYNL
jgi:hypothetical protein